MEWSGGGGGVRREFRSIIGNGFSAVWPFVSIVYVPEVTETAEPSSLNHWQIMVGMPEHTR